MNSQSISIYKRLYRTMATTYGNLFLGVVSCVIVLFIGYLLFSAYTLRTSQKEIKKCYSDHIQKADNMYANLINYSSETLNSYQSANSALLVDSLIKYSLVGNKTLSKVQFESLSSIISQHYDAVLKMHERNSIKLQKDSLYLSAERVLLEGQTKSMIDLHLNKIEHEYSNITMWAAILTVIFLVFSFYSIFKMDELIKQGDEGVKEIRSIKNESNAALEGFKMDSAAALSKIEANSKEEFKKSSMVALEATASFTKKIEEMEALNRESLDSVEAVKMAFEGKTKATVKAFEESLRKMSESVEKDMSQKIAEFNSLIAQASDLLNNLKAPIEEADNGREGEK